MGPGSVMKQIKVQEQHAFMRSSATSECRSVSLQLTDHNHAKRTIALTLAPEHSANSPCTSDRSLMVPVGLAAVAMLAVEVAEIVILTITMAAPRRGDDGRSVYGRDDNGRRDDGGGDDGLDDNGRSAMKVAAAKLEVWTTAVAMATVAG